MPLGEKTSTVKYFSKILKFRGAALRTKTSYWANVKFDIREKIQNHFSSTSFIHYDTFLWKCSFGARVVSMQNFIFVSEKVSELERFKL